MRFRDYQQNAIDSAFREWESVASTMIVAPTGTGKTVIMAGIVKRAFPRRVLVIAHREELIFQAEQKIGKMAGVAVGIEMAGRKIDEINESWFGKPTVVVSTVQTQTAGGDGLGRMGKFDPKEFGILLIDECHHATASTYKRIIEYYKTNSNLKVLGVTATPDRADEEALGQVFESVAFDYEINDAIHDGWLVPIRQQMVEVSGLDYSSIRTTAGDLNGADLADVLEDEDNLHKMAGPTIDIVGDRRTLVFCAGVRQAERMSEILNRHREGMAGFVCGKTPKEQRRELLRKFENGEIQVVCNCGVLTEGFDNPGVEVIIMGRPTKSRSLYAQMVGRATRPLTGVVDKFDSAEERRSAIRDSAKTHCLVVDFVGNSGRHKLVTSADILGGKYSEDVIEQAELNARKSGGPVDMDEELEKAQDEILERKRREAANRARLTARAKYSIRSIDPFDAFDLKPTRERGWEKGKSLSAKQKEILLKQGIDPEKRTYHENKQILDEFFRRWKENLCSYKQAAHLKRYGIPSDVTAKQASTILDGIWKNKMRPEAAYESAMASAVEVADAVPF
jgi:superfamily II DNA or RNA helicase